MTAARTVVRVVAGVAGAFFVLPALLVFLFGLLVLADELDKTAGTTGTISAPPGPRPSASGDDFGAGTCVLLVEFVADGRTYTATSSDSSSSNCDRMVGETVEVRYDPSDPDENTVDSADTKLIGVLMMAGAAIWGVVVLGVVWLVFRGTRSMGGAPGRAVSHPAPSSPAPSSPTPSATAPSSAPPSSVAIDAAPAPVPDVVWDPSSSRVRPEAPGWYPTGDGTVERWYNGLSWSDATRQPPA